MLGVIPDIGDEHYGLLEKIGEYTVGCGGLTMLELFGDDLNEPACKSDITIAQVLAAVVAYIDERCEPKGGGE